MERGFFASIDGEPLAGDVKLELPVLVDATSLVVSNELLTDKRPTALSLLCLSNVIDAMVLNDSPITLKVRTDEHGRYANAIGKVDDIFHEAEISPRIPGDHLPLLLQDPDAGELGLLSWRKLDYISQETRLPTVSIGSIDHAAADVVSSLTNYRRNPIFARELSAYFSNSLFSLLKWGGPADLPRQGNSSSRQWGRANHSVGANGTLIAYRSQLYFHLANLMGVPLRADATKRKFLESSVPDYNRRCYDLVRGTLNKIDEVDQIRVGKLNLEADQELIGTRTPLMMSYILSRTSQASDLLQEVKEVRNSSAARKLRAAFKRVDGILRSEVQASTESKAEALNDIDIAIRGLTGEFDVEAANLAIQTVARLGSGILASGSNPESHVEAMIRSVPFDRFGQLIRQWFSSRNYVLLRDVYDEVDSCKGITSEVERVFGRGLDSKQVSLLDALQS